VQLWDCKVVKCVLETVSSSVTSWSVSMEGRSLRSHVDDGLFLPSIEKDVGKP
jgi:hypothetical protein